MAGLPRKPNCPLPTLAEATQHVYKASRPKAVWKLANKVDEIRPEITSTSCVDVAAAKNMSKANGNSNTMSNKLTAAGNIADITDDTQVEVPMDCEDDQEAVALEIANNTKKDKKRKAADTSESETLHSNLRAKANDDHSNVHEDSDVPSATGSAKKRKFDDADVPENLPSVKRARTSGKEANQFEDGEVRSDTDMAKESNDHDAVRKQVEYYFSDTNLPKDSYLFGKLMQNESTKAVKLDIICTFKRMQPFQSRTMIVEALKSSKTVQLLDNNSRVQRRSPLPQVAHPPVTQTYSQVSEEFQGPLQPDQIVNGTMQYDPHKKTFYTVDADGQKTAWMPVAPKEHVNFAQVVPKPPTTEKAISTLDDKAAASPTVAETTTKRKRKAPDHEYGFRSTTVKYDHMRSRPHYDPEGRHIYDEEEPATKRTKVGSAPNATTTAVQTKKKSKHKRHSNAKPKEQTSIKMRFEDLIPHYRPKRKEVLAAEKAEKAAQEKEKKLPATFMDLPTEARRNIWDKVFEDEAYHFKIKKQSNRDSWKLMVPSKPPSFGCLLINKTCHEEVQEEMYRSMKLEIEFGRLRPAAMKEFITKITQHKIGRMSERIFFIKKFGLQKVNLGSFISAKEIVSTHWTVEGDDKMEEDDYKNNRIDPAHVLEAPPSKEKLKGLKERRLWADQEAATHRYEKHLAGTCHPNYKPEIRDEKDDVVQVEQHKGVCVFDDACLNLERTKMVIVVKYKVGCLKGRHARHKEVFYDLYPLLGDKLVQTRAPKAKFHKKCNKKGCQEA